MLFFYSLLSNSQKAIARVAEMIHTASLVHDDIIDLADSRRGKPSTHNIWGEKEAVLAGNYIMSRATIALARLGNTEVIELLSRVIDDLVRGIVKNCTQIWKVSIAVKNNFYNTNNYSDCK